MTDERFICKRCGMKFYERPTRHGITHMTIYPHKPKPTKICNGKVVPIEENEESERTRREEVEREK